MFGRLFRRETEADSIASDFYGAIVAQARNPLLYEDFGVPDTVSGRFELVVLHVALVLTRLQGGEPQKAVGQKIFDLYCRDMDRSLRELGIGDLGVPKRMKKMAEAFYGRAAAYGEALGGRDEKSLAEAISRNVFAGPAVGATLLAAYALASSEALAAIPDDILLAAPPRFADASTFVSSGAAAEVVA